MVGAARCSRNRFACDAQQTGDHRIETGVQLVEPTQSDDRALLGPFSVVAVGLDELNVAARAGVGEFHKHTTTLVAFVYSIKGVETSINVPLHNSQRFTPKSLIPLASHGNLASQLLKSGGPSTTDYPSAYAPTPRSASLR